MNITHRVKPELLAPAGTYENAEMAIKYGADAIYQGLEGFSLRTGKKAEVDVVSLKKTISLVKENGKKYYLAINLFAHNKDINLLKNVLPKLANLEIDAFIVSDPGVINLIRKNIPAATIHLSTQSNTLNYLSVNFWEAQGVSRIILARELTRAEIKEIKEFCEDIELELFVHGAMCMAYSGRCNLSLYYTDRDANKGDCSQPCRWEYSLKQKGSDRQATVEQDESGFYVFNSNDLNLAVHIQDLIKDGIASLKIEGRNKTSYYIANTIRVYRKLIDDAAIADGKYVVPEKYLNELEKTSHRKYTTGYYGQDENLFNFKSADYLKTTKLVGVVEKTEEGKLFINIRDEIRLGEELEIVMPNINSDKRFKVVSIFDEKKQTNIDAAHNSYYVSIPFSGEEDYSGVLIRKYI